MAKVTGPLLSFTASGSIAKSQVYARWRGVQYARQRVIPSNPNSSEQQLTRNAFKWLQAVWKFAVAELSAPWTAAASGRPLTNRNLWTKQNLALIRDAGDITAIVMSPGANGGLIAAAATATGGSGTITGSMTAPVLPSGFTVSEAIMVAIAQQDAETGTKYSSYVATDATSPYAPAISALAAGVYAVGMYFKYTAPNNKIAYGPSITVLATVT